ncbi:1-acyl-sn-glycerol-3-phosphate acyltransferase [Friedmanniella luteola]|uniref:1-acyl-sn-glycerol-3-phosphate acyltransferase n=1 Tax=Friedmanniella luteola TaxID=546871 RepID=A0A1H2ACR8_9ACTN|nr:lysophospholipid acyltransferase family protein [Friedmanniella luteola]SDT43761.1 1-acyl-sn-glycerol-3-phosphate acyltransferase [Friedmanniella luteola]
MSSRSRYTSPVHAGARFVAQRLILKPAIWRMTTVTVLGEENLAGVSGPYVVVSNHSSHLDAPLIITALPRKLSRYVAAGAAADYFFDVWWRKGLTSLFFNAFPVDRTGLRGRKGLATSLLDDGVPLLLFPEGTRSRTGEMGSFKPGAAALCISRDVPCLPVALVGASEAMPHGRNWPDRGRPPVYVTFGEPMRPEEGEKVAQFSERIAKAVRSLYDYTTSYRDDHA